MQAVPHATNTLAVICGASQWPRLPTFQQADAYTNTATALRDYLTSATGLALPAENVLWLFDSPATAVEQLDQIYTFLTDTSDRTGSTRSGRGNGVWVLFGYVGHGAFFGPDRAYCLLLRDTHEPVLAETSLRVSGLASLLKAALPDSSRVVILDSCFAGVAFKDFQSDVGQVAHVKVDEALTHSNNTRGVALLCAASARNPARITDNTTLFGGALLHTLRSGDPDLPEPMSLRRICELAHRHLADTVGDPPIPEVHSPDQHSGDIAGVALFPNPAVSTRPAALPESLRLGLDSPYPEIRKTAVEKLGIWLNSTDPREVLAARHHLESIAAQDSYTVAAAARALLSGATPTTSESNHHTEPATATPTSTPARSDPHRTTTYHLAGTITLQPSRGRFWADVMMEARIPVAFSPDGQSLATTTGDYRAVLLWDPATHLQIGEPLTGHNDWVQAVAFSPDGRMLATASDDRTVRLWDPATHQQIGEPLTGHTGGVRAVAFSPDGRVLATASNDATVRLWDPATHQQIGEPLWGHTYWVRAATFSPDGRVLATASADATVRLWDPATHQQIGEPLNAHTHWVRSVAFSPDGRILATASDDKTVRLWDPATHQQIGEPLTGHSNNVQAVAFSPDGRVLATGSDDKTVRLWDPATHQQIGEPLTGHTNCVQAVAFSPDGRMLTTVGRDRAVRLYAVQPT